MRPFGSRLPKLHILALPNCERPMVQVERVCSKFMGAVITWKHCTLVWSSQWHQSPLQVPNPQGPNAQLQLLAQTLDVLAIFKWPTWPHASVSASRKPASKEFWCWAVYECKPETRYECMRFPMCHLLCIPGVGHGKAVSGWGRVGVGWKTPKPKPNNLELEEKQ